jgi:hypothetical protein
VACNNENNVVIVMKYDNENMANVCENNEKIA